MLKGVLALLKKIRFEFILICIFFVLCLCFPLSVDDWAWGGDLGLSRLFSGFSNYNGRWFSNILIIIIARNRILRAVIEVGVFALIFFLFGRIFRAKRRKLLPVLTIGLLMVPIGIFRQSVVWASGFVNYVTPVLFLLATFAIGFGKLWKKDKNIYSFMFFAIGFLSALLVENFTILMLCFCVFLCIIAIKSKKYIKRNVSHLIGVAAGAILMFSNECYHSIAIGSDSYRSMPDGNIFERAWSAFRDSQSDLLVGGNVFLNIAIVVLVVILLSRFIKEKKNNNENKKRFAKIFCVFYILYGLLNILINSSWLNIGPGRVFKNFSAILNILYCFSLIVACWLFVEKRIRRQRLLIWLFSIAILELPMLFVTPWGPRNYFATYFIFVLVCVELICYLKIKFIKTRTLAIIAILFFVPYCYIYSQAFIIEQIRNNAIAKQLGNEKIYLPLFPSWTTRYVHSPNPSKGYWTNNYKNYYGINNDTKIEWLTLRKYLKKEKQLTQK